MDFQGYEPVRRYWDKVFGREDGEAVPSPPSPNTGLAAIDEGLDWLCRDAASALDFGCGSGALLLRCALRGTRRHTGIDLSPAAIAFAGRLSAVMDRGLFQWRCGGVEELAGLAAGGFDCAILSNIADNLTPADARAVLRHIHRIVREDGRIFFKVNPFLTDGQIDAWGIQRLPEGLLLEPDGLYLWNLTDGEWEDVLGPLFAIEGRADVYYEQHDQTNRLFLLVNRAGGTIAP